MNDKAKCIVCGSRAILYDKFSDYEKYKCSKCDVFFITGSAAYFIRSHNLEYKLEHQDQFSFTIKTEDMKLSGKNDDGCEVRFGDDIENGEKFISSYNTFMTLLINK